MRRSLNYRSVLGIGDWGLGISAKPQAVSTDNSSFILHPSSFHLQPSVYSLKPKAYTLVEILVATTLTMLLMGVVVQLFGTLGQSITDSRAILEASERLRSAAARLQMDLQGVTVTMLPPRNPDDGEGYFEYIEGPVTQGFDWLNKNPAPPNDIRPKPVNSEIAGNPLDTSVGDFDDILMFTTRSTSKPFIGLFNGGSVQSDVAEVAWFIRGRTLYRRQLLVASGLPVPSAIANATGFYANNDISVRVENDNLLANTLSDLTRRECRYAHSGMTPPHATIHFPFDARVWGALGLPTLRECSYINTTQNAAWIVGTPASPLAPDPTVDFWSNDPSKRYADDWLTRGTKNPGDNISERVADDVILTNVIGFDVKAWDPGAPVMVSAGGTAIMPGDPAYIPNAATAVSFGAYVDLGYAFDYLSLPGYPQPFFNQYGDPLNKSLLKGSLNAARVYDTWSTHYESVGLYGLTAAEYPPGGFPGRGVNGFDDPGSSGVANGVVDDEEEKITSPPYPAPLRGIQVKIRIFEPDSRQIREVTIVQEFLPK
jgi:hypothetical protein